MWDVIMNTVGALAVSSLGWGYVVRGEHSFLEDWIQTFIERSMRLFRWGSTQDDVVKGFVTPQLSPMALT
jgi:hypothetical protein